MWFIFGAAGFFYALFFETSFIKSAFYLGLFSDGYPAMLVVGDIAGGVGWGLPLALIGFVIDLFLNKETKVNKEHFSNNSQVNKAPVTITPQVNQLHEKKTKSIIGKSNEEKIYLQIHDELENKTYDKALWIKLYAEENGDENKTKASYIRQRYAILNPKSSSSNTVIENIPHKTAITRINPVSTPPPNDNDYFPFNKFTVIDTVREFGVDRETAKKILTLNIRKSNGYYLYKNLSFNTLYDALEYAKDNPQNNWNVR